MAAPKRDLERHQIIKRQIREIEQTRLDHLAQAPAKGPHAMVLLLARVVGIGVQTADMLVQEVLSRNMRSLRGPFIASTVAEVKLPLAASPFCF